MLKLQVHRELLIVALSFLVQLPLAVFLGHHYDQRSFIDTGYLVSSGLNPYEPHFITVFSNPALVGVNPIIGYPPLWPLLLGLIYRLTYNLVPSLFLYNFAIKIPVIISNIALAFVTKAVMVRTGLPRRTVWFAWLFLLFNPLTLLTTAAWGEFDTLIAVLCVSALYFLSRGKVVESSLLLSLSVVLKPISFPLLGLPLLYRTGNHHKNRLYICILIVFVFSLWILPFNLLGWMAPDSPSQVTAFFRMAGGMTLFNGLEIVTNTATMPPALDFLGYLWIPLLLLGYYYFYRHPPCTFKALVEASAVLVLVSFLSRSWLSEPNLNLLLPLLLIMVGFGVVRWRFFHLVWVVPFVFLFLNYAFPQLFFLVYPQVVPAIGRFDLQFGVSRLLARFAVTVLWYVVALRLIYLVVRKRT